MDTTKLSNLIASSLLNPDDVVVVYQCPECGHIYHMSLAGCPGVSTWVCSSCSPPEDTKEAYENFPKMLGAYVKGDKP